jgi:holo-[acyl-carrier protein] synthase
MREIYWLIAEALPFCAKNAEKDMILGIGTDIVEIARIEHILYRREGAFLRRCFTPQEQSEAESFPLLPRRAAFLAKRFAAKEAAAKAFGTGFDGRFGLKDIGVERGAGGAPSLVFYGGALRVMAGLCSSGVRAHLSLSDDAGVALAFVVLEGCS